MMDLVQMIHYLPTVGRVILVGVGVMFIILGIIEAISEKYWRPLVAVAIGIVLVVAEIFIPIAVINGIVAGIVIVFLGIFLIAIACS